MVYLIVEEGVKMNFNDIFKDNPSREILFNKSNYPKGILMCGFIDLDLAKVRLEKGEYYTLVTYKNGQELPDCYRSLDALDDETLLASVKPSQYISGINLNGSIQMVTQLNFDEHDACYLLGPGPNTVQLLDLIEASKEDLKQLLAVKSR